MQASFHNVVIPALGHVLPQEIWSSEAMEEQLHETYHRLHLSVGRLELMTGIRERRIWHPGMLASRAAASAAQALFEGHPGAQLHTIDLIINASVCRDRLEPATASYVHHLLSLPSHTQAFDLSNACLGFINAMWVAASQIECGLIRSALIVSGENSRPLLESTLQALQNPSLDRHQIKPYFANLTIGSASVAMLLCHRHLAPTAPRLLGGSALADTNACHLCEGDAMSDSWQMQTDSEALLHAGIALARRNWPIFLQQIHWKTSSIHHFISHQVGKRHQEQFYEALELDRQKDFSTFSFLGNTGSVALPITLSIAWGQQRFRPGDRVALLGIGSGLHSIMMGIEFPKI
ncbi:MAG: 3-oxoacyl-ACP synthase III [Puniceicoccales bacterium]|jgi:3-oxoacyl-[acyl-carrier-protein] synthase-3|nr:3-oxoacyl-ACP synthase III [Puniceicoccales bacterium]